MKDMSYYPEWFTNNYNQIVNVYEYANKEVVGQYESVDDYIRDNLDDFLVFAENQYKDYLKEVRGENDESEMVT